MEFDYQTAKLATILAVTNLVVASSAYLMLTTLDPFTAIILLTVFFLGIPTAVEYFLLKRGLKQNDKEES